MTKQPLFGAQFRITTASGEFVPDNKGLTGSNGLHTTDRSGSILGRYTTGRDGTVTVTGLIPNSTVVVSESRVPDGYVLDPTPQIITVKNGSGNSWTSGAVVGPKPLPLGQYKIIETTAPVYWQVSGTVFKVDRAWDWLKRLIMGGEKSDLTELEAGEGVSLSFIFKMHSS